MTPPARRLRLTAAGILQLSESYPLAARRRAWSATAYPELIPSERTERWMEAHERVFQFRSLNCGGMQTPAIRFGSADFQT